MKEQVGSDDHALSILDTLGEASDRGRVRIRARARILDLRYSNRRIRIRVETRIGSRRKGESRVGPERGIEGPRTWVQVGTGVREGKG